MWPGDSPGVQGQGIATYRVSGSATKYTTRSNEMIKLLRKAVCIYNQRADRNLRNLMFAQTRHQGRISFCARLYRIKTSDPEVANWWGLNNRNVGATHGITSSSSIHGNSPPVAALI